LQGRKQIELAAIIEDNKYEAAAEIKGKEDQVRIKFCATYFK
jgi:hypothetical protein